MVEEVLEHLKGDGQFLETRNDQTPILMDRDGGAKKARARAKLFAERKCSWAKAEEVVGREKRRRSIDDFRLTALVQSEHLLLLVGSDLKA